MLPFIVLLTINIITLICWTAIAPLKFVRTWTDGTDPWNRKLGSYGHCESTSGTAGNSIPFLIVIGTVNITALVVANYQAYRARNVRTEFNESSYIAMANASFLQAILMGVPIIFLTREAPSAFFIVISVVLFILSGAILACIFVPKIIALKEKNNGKLKSSVKVSGLADVPTAGAASSLRSRTSSIRCSEGASGGGSGDPVEDILQQFRCLSWKDKMAVSDKIGASQAVPVPVPASVTEPASSSEGSKKVDFNVDETKADASAGGFGMISVPEATEATETTDFSEHSERPAKIEEFAPNESV